MLAALGQPPEAAPVYLWLTTRPAPVPVAEVAQALDLAQDTARELLDALVAAHLCRRPQPGHYRAVNPAPVLGRWLEQVDQELRDALDAASHARTDLESVQEHYQRSSQPVTRAADLTVLATPSSIMTTLEELTATCREVRTIHPTTPGADSLAAALPHDQMLVARGVRVQAVYPTGARQEAEVMDLLRLGARSGIRVRLHPHPRTRLVLVDDGHALIAHAPDEGDFSGVLVSVPGVVTALRHTFDLLWHGGEELAGRGRTDELSAVEREVLRLLLEGHKDAGIGRRLDLSVRTIRRIITRLSDLSGTSGRFALGVRAVELGWVSAAGGPVEDPGPAGHEPSG